ncbi:acyl-CoA transferase [Seohaeicola saemankumensis]|uniref:acyl-CoA transferase n=1 Tax=Seohaeicola saemankumensis TaxID=481181 RepID=UPI0035D11943
MESPRESILIALKDLLRTIPRVSVLRGEVLPERIPPSGLMILRDGDPGEPGVTLSPLMYNYQHRAELEVIVQTGADRDARFDRLIGRIGAAIVADRTLGGRCDWIEAEAPEPVDLPIEGAATLKAAIVPIILHYATSDVLC